MTVYCNEVIVKNIYTNPVTLMMDLRPLVTLGPGDAQHITGKFDRIACDRVVFRQNPAANHELHAGTTIVIENFNAQRLVLHCIEAMGQQQNINFIFP